MLSINADTKESSLKTFKYVKSAEVLFVILK